MIPAPERFDVQVKICELMSIGTPSSEAEAERLYRGILPLIVFMMSSIDTFVCYGTRITGRRLGMAEVLDRAPCQRPSEFGLLMAERFAAALPSF